MANNLNEVQVLRALLSEDFKSFVHKVFLELNPNTEYKYNWHIDVLWHHMMNVMGGSEKRLIVNMPPRHLKSIVCSVAFPAFILGHNPSDTIICVSYAEDFAIRLALDCRKIMETDWYKEIFPATRLNPAKKAVNDFMTTRGGGRFATSVGGVLTGRGADYLIIDDPIKADDAKSETVRNGVNEWSRNTLYSRLNDKKEGKILLIMQRVHQVDLTGYFLEGGGFKLIRMPSIAMEDEVWTARDRITGRIQTFKRAVGEALHPAREDVNVLNGIKDDIWSLNFAGQYQQDPMAEDGGIIKKEYIKYYDPKILPTSKDRWTSYEAYIDKIVTSWDTAYRTKSNNDYSVGITFIQMSNGKIYVADVIREKLEAPALLARIRLHSEYITDKYAGGYGYQPVNVVESIGAGISLAQILKKDYRVKVQEGFSREDKETRLRMVSYLLETGKCMFPNNNPSWLEPLLRELFAFPIGKHDDQCDALSQGLLFLSKGPRYSLVGRPG